MRKCSQSIHEFNRRGFLQTVGVTGALSLKGSTRLPRINTISTERKVIEVTPGDSLIDERITTTLAGFEPNDDATVWAQVTDDNYQTLSSFGRFKTDDDRAFDLVRHAPKVGILEGVKLTNVYRGPQ